MLAAASVTGCATGAEAAEAAEAAAPFEGESSEAETTAGPVGDVLGIGSVERDIRREDIFFEGVTNVIEVRSEISSV
jgi:hypothetical protein